MGMGGVWGSRCVDLWEWLLCGAGGVGFCVFQVFGCLGRARWVLGAWLGRGSFVWFWMGGGGDEYPRLGLDWEVGHRYGWNSQTVSSKK